MKNISILILLSFISIYSQEKAYVNVFDKFIPDIIKSDKEGLNQIYETIDWTTQLHPSLLYYYFEYLDLRFNKNITNPDSNYSRSLSAQRNEYRKKRNDFASRQEQKIEEKKYVRIKENAMLSCISDLFSDYDEDISADTSDQLDINKQNFYSVVYLTGRNEDYNTDVDYSVFLQEETKKKIEYFKSKRNNSNNMNRDEQLSFIEDINKHWYFFDKSEKYFNQKLDFEPNELAQEVYLNDFFINEKFNAQIFYHFLNKNQITTEVADILTIYKITGSTGSGRNINTKINIKLENFFSVFAGYRHKIENEYSFLSYIDFNLGFSINNVEFDPPLSSTFFEMAASRPGEHIEANGIIKKESGFNYSALSKITVPVLYVNSFLYFKAGALYEFRSSSFNYNTVINETITDPQGNKTSTVFSNSGSYSHTVHLLTGIASLNISASDNIDIIIEGNFGKNIGSSLGLAYDF